MDKIYSIHDLIDIDRLRALFENFSKATGFTTGFVSYPEQELLIATGWREICTKFHRTCPASAACCKESNVYLTACLKDLKELSIKPCGNGLVDGATPVIIRGMHLASLATGQVLLAPPDIDFFKRLASEYGYDTDEYLAALAKVPVVTEEQLKSVLIFLSGLAVQIAEEGMNRLRIQETADQLRKAKEEVDGQVAKQTAELQKVDQALQQREVLLQEICETIPDPIFVKDLESRILLANPAFLRAAGRSAGEVLGKRNDEFFSDLEMAQVVIENDKSVINSGVAAVVEETIPTTDGMRVYLATKAPYRDINGRIIGTIGISHDITDRKRAEDALRASMARYKLLTESMPDIFTSVDLNLNYIYWNRVAVELSGISASEVLGKKRSEIFGDTEETRKIVACCRECIDTKRLIQFENETLVEGRKHVFELRFFPTDEGVSIIGRDITKRKLAERALRESELALQEAQAKLQAHAEDLERTVASRTARLSDQTAELQAACAALSESEERYRSVVENIGIGIALISPTMEILQINPQLRKWNRRIEFSERSICYRTFNNPERSEVCPTCPTVKTLKDGLVHEAIVEAPFEGEIKNYRIISSPIKNDGGEVVAAVEMVEDITERKRLEKEILEISEFEKQRLGQDLHDDICQALRGAASQTKVIANRLNQASNPESGSVLAISRFLQQSAGHVRSMARTLFPSQLTANGFVAGLNELASHVERSFRIPCSCEFLAQPILHDEKQASHLYRIAQEALTNAAKHSQATRLSLSVKSEGGVLALIVTDNGVGIDNLSQDGKGMGMNIMQYRAHQIGATLEIQSNPATGTTVVCSLPLPEAKPALLSRSGSKSPGEADFLTLREHGLTRRECEVLYWIAQGKRDGEVAVILSISMRTINHHVSKILEKLGVETRTAATAHALELLL